MSSREIILQRIREALSVPAPKPGAHDHHGGTCHSDHAHGHAAVEPHFNEWLPIAGETEQERIDLFRKNATDLRADFRQLDSEKEFGTALAALAKEEGWKQIAAHPGDLVTPALRALELPKLIVDPGYDRALMEQSDAGITECDALVAQTGTVILTTRSAGGRALSVLPPHHVVLARRSQLLPDLPAAFRMLKEKYGASYPSMMTLVTGPSRTGDIERILVLGAHGPKKLTILFG